MSWNHCILLGIKILVGNEIILVHPLFHTSHVAIPLHQRLVEVNLIVKDVSVHLLLTLDLLLDLAFIIQLVFDVFLVSLILLRSHFLLIVLHFLFLLHLLSHHLIGLLECSLPIIKVTSIFVQ